MRTQVRPRFPSLLASRVRSPSFLALPSSLAGALAPRLALRRPTRPCAHSYTALLARQVRSPLHALSPRPLIPLIATSLTRILPLQLAHTHSRDAQRLLHF